MKKKVISIVFSVMLSLCVVAVFCGCAAKNTDDGSKNSGGDVVSVLKFNESDSGSYVFCTDKNVVTVDIPKTYNGKDVIGIGYMAFDYCEKLKSITIPNSIKAIAKEAFRSCYALTSITYCGTTSQWNAITKGDNWRQGVHFESCVVHCTDGNLNLAGNQVS